MPSSHRQTVAHEGGFLPHCVGQEPADHAVWPIAGGEFGTKEAATKTLKELARRVGVEANITGHMCWVTGAQAMAVAGIEVWLIQAFCRWGSEAILGYLRDGQLAITEHISGRVQGGYGRQYCAMSCVRTARGHSHTFVCTDGRGGWGVLAHM